MTKDEIMYMPAGRGVDVLIAENVMEWKKVPSTDDPAGWCWLAPHGSTRASTTESIPRFTTDISAAWDVVEKLKENGVYVILCVLENDYQCELDKIKVNERAYDSAIAETAPLAICRAALLATL